MTYVIGIFVRVLEYMNRQDIKVELMYLMNWEK